MAMAFASKIDPTSEIAICETQRKIEQTPSEPIAPPQATGTYVMDKSVVAGMSMKTLKLPAHTYPNLVVSVTYTRDKNSQCSQLWGVIVGKDC